MVDKRLRKGQTIRDAIIPPEYAGDSDPDILLVCWGSTKGSVTEAAARLRDRGTRAATLHFSQVWPLDPDSFADHLAHAAKTICIEGNATGQFARHIEFATGMIFTRKLNRYDGLPVTPGWILKEL